MWAVEFVEQCSTSFGNVLSGSIHLYVLVYTVHTVVLGDCGGTEVRVL